MTVELGKTYRTYAGHPVRIYAVDGVGECPVHGAFEGKAGWTMFTWTASGSCSLKPTGPKHLELVEGKPRIQRESWVNIYPDIYTTTHPSKKEADSIATRNRIACVKIAIDCEEGEGLEN